IMRDEVRFFCNFFFQAEDGIRDRNVTGVQTCALPILIAGIAGAMFYQSIYKVFRMNSTVGRGVGLGSSSHAIGTAKALESSELEGSISTVAMILSAVFVSLLTPI